MAINTAADILVQPGKLVWGATDISIALPHGGTELGFTTDGIRLSHNQETREIIAEETGIAPQEIVYLGEAWRLEVVLKQWDDDVLARLFPNTVAGGTSGELVIEYPGGTAFPGFKLSGQADVLVFSPTDLTNNKVVLVRKAVPVAAREISFGVGEDSDLAVIFHAIPDESILSGDANGRFDSRTIAIGDRLDLTI